MKQNNHSLNMYISNLDITGFLPIDEHFCQGKDKNKLFAVIAGNDNSEFGIKEKAYILCEIAEVKNGDLVVDKERIGTHQNIYKVMRMKKQGDFTYLENKNSRKILKPDYKPFGKVLRIFNID